MKTLRSIVLLYLLLLNITSAEIKQSLNNLAVIIESEDIKDEEIILIENRLTSYIIHTEEYRVLARRELNVLLKEQKLQASGLFNESNIIEPGSFIGANKILYGAISDLGNAWNFDFKIINVSSGIIESSNNKIVLKDLISMLNAIDDIGSTLFHHIGETNSSPKSIIPDIPIRDFRLSNNKLVITQQFEQIIQDSKIISIDIISDRLIICNYKGNIEKIEFNPELLHQNLFSYPKWFFTCSALEESKQYYSTGSVDGIVFLWDTERWGSPYQLTGHSSTINTLEFSRNDRFLYSGDDVGTLIIWDSYSHEIYSRNIISEQSITKLNNSGDGKGLYIQLEDGSINLYSLINNKIVITEHGGRRVSADITMNNSKNLVVSGNEDGSIQFWEVSYYSETQYVGNTWLQPHITLQKTVALNDSPVSVLSFSPSDDLIAVGYLNGEIIFYDMINKNNYSSNNFSLNDSITSLEFLKDQQILVGTQKGKFLVMEI